MKTVFNTLESMMNKSRINKFRHFLNRYSYVTKWFMCSDYCLDDKRKKNNVVSFVLFPYIMDFGEWNDYINSLQKTDLKHSRKVSDEFCEFLNEGKVFCFNFILDKKCRLEKWKNRESLIQVINEYIDMIQAWQLTTPKNSEHYKEMEKQFNELLNETRKKTFSYKLLARIFEVTFLASYIKYLLFREKEELEIYSWLSDRDKMTSAYGNIYQQIYEITSHCLLSNHNLENKEKIVKELILQDVNQNMFHDPLNRVPDIICGAIADMNYNNGEVSGDKQKKVFEKIISDNVNIVTIHVSEKFIAGIEHISRTNNWTKKKDILRGGWRRRSWRRRNWQKKNEREMKQKKKKHRY